MIPVFRLAKMLEVKGTLFKSMSLFANDTWKERDDAAQKVYINRKQRDALKKLLDKVEKESSDKKSGSQEFEGRLKQIMWRYKLDNQALASQISNIHQDLREN